MKINPKNLYGVIIGTSEAHVIFEFKPLTRKQRIMGPVWTAWDEVVYPSLLLSGSITAFTIAVSAFERLFP